MVDTSEAKNLGHRFNEAYQNQVDRRVTTVVDSLTGKVESLLKTQLDDLQTEAALQLRNITDSPTINFQIWLQAVYEVSGVLRTQVQGSYNVKASELILTQLLQKIDEFGDIPIINLIKEHFKKLHQQVVESETSTEVSIVMSQINLLRERIIHHNPKIEGESITSLIAEFMPLIRKLIEQLEKQGLVYLAEELTQASEELDHHYGKHVENDVTAFILLFGGTETFLMLIHQLGLFPTIEPDFLAIPIAIGTVLLIMLAYALRAKAFPFDEEKAVQLLAKLEPVLDRVGKPIDLSAEEERLSMPGSIDDLETTSPITDNQNYAAS